MKGRAGAYSFYSSKGRQVVRVSQNSTNYGESARRSPAQQNRRVRWANLVNFYKASQSFMKGAFESKKANETDYNAFMRKNLPLARIFLEKEEAAVSACVVDQYVVSEGSLPTITKEYNGLEVVTNLKATGSITAQTLVSDFTENLLAANPWMTEGMQISIIEFVQGVDSGYPRASVIKKEVTLSRTNTRPLGAYFPSVLFNVDDEGVLTIDAGWGATSGGTLILSDSTSGRTKVSTERVWLDSMTLINTYSSQGQLDQAMESYGVDPTYFLESGSEPVAPVDPVQRILTAIVNNSYVRNGETLRVQEGAALQSLRFTTAIDVNPFVGVWIFIDDETYELDAEYYTAEGRMVALTSDGIEAIKNQYGADNIPIGVRLVTSAGNIDCNWTVVRY